MLNAILMTNSIIPKIIHQIAPSDKTLWHPLWFKCQKSWLTHFPNFEYKLWNDKEDIDNFVLTKYPQFANLYNNFQVQIMKIDFARLCILDYYGGIYGDMDYFVYKNFYDQLNKDVGLVENLTEEYTSAIAENCLMYSTPNNAFMYSCMFYCKTCFLLYKNNFKKDNNNDWRAHDCNSHFVNNTTGSGMLSAAYRQLSDVLDIQLLPTQIFNNRPASYDPSFVGKHTHSSIWGNEYVNHIKNKIFIEKNGSFWLLTPLDDKFESEGIEPENFNFYVDYSNGQYLKTFNLDHIKQLINSDS